jgi:hypothetical protein
MAAQVIAIERRQYCREGVIGQLEDITYAALRKYGITGEIKADQTNPSAQPTATIH